MLAAVTIEERLFTLIGKKLIVTKGNTQMTIQDRVYNISKAKKEIGYEPMMSMEQGIRTVVEWYEEKGIL